MPDFEEEFNDWDEEDKNELEDEQEIIINRGGVHIVLILCSMDQWKEPTVILALLVYQSPI